MTYDGCPAKIEYSGKDPYFIGRIRCKFTSSPGSIINKSPVQPRSPVQETRLDVDAPHVAGQVADVHHQPAVRHAEPLQGCGNQFRYDAALFYGVEVGVTGYGGTPGCDHAGLEHVDAVRFHLVKLPVVAGHGESEMMDAAAALPDQIRIDIFPGPFDLDEFDLHFALKGKNDVHVDVDRFAPVDSFVFHGVRAIPGPDVEEFCIAGRRFGDVFHDDADLVDVGKIHPAETPDV